MAEPDDERDQKPEDLFTDLDKFFAPIEDDDWPEEGKSEESATAERVAVPRFPHRRLTRERPTLRSSFPKPGKTNRISSNPPSNHLVETKPLWNARRPRNRPQDRRQLASQARSGCPNRPAR
jgi:hypothetical protein